MTTLWSASAGIAVEKFTQTITKTLSTKKFGAMNVPTPNSKGESVWNN